MTAKPILLGAALNPRTTKQGSRGTPTKMLSLKNRSSLVAAIVWFIFQTVSLHATINVVSYWRMGENDPGAAAGVTATNATDFVGAKNLTFHGNASYTSDVAASAATHTASSLSVNFTNSAYATNAIVSSATDNFGIECWVKSTDPSTDQIIAYNGHGSFSGWGLMIHQTNYCGLFGGVVFIGAAPVVTNVWTHLTLARASGTTTLYVNGTPTATTTASPNIPATLFALGASPQVSSGYFKGYLDEVRVFTFAPGQFSTNDLLLYTLPPPPFPVVTTMGPTQWSTTNDSMIVNGTVNPKGLPTTVLWQWGPSQFPYSRTRVTGFFGGGFYQPYSVPELLRGLTPGVTYHYRLVATNALGVFPGGDFQFWAPVLTLNSNNPVYLKDQTWTDPGAIVHAAPSGIAAGDEHSLALKVDGTVVGWGYDFEDQTDIPASATNVVAIAAGFELSLALKADGTVIGWGRNYQGELNIPASATNVVEIAVLGDVSLALKADGTVLAWGDNSDDELNIPASATNVVAIAAGASHCLALRADGTIVGWGDNNSGEINVPVSATNVVAIAAGVEFSLALKADGTVVGWGYGYGVPFGSKSILPASATNVVAIAQNLALKADGTVLAWGYDYGLTNVPVSATNVIAIAAGGGHSLALKADGTVVGWGQNTYGQTNIPPGLDILNLPVTSIDNVNTNVPGSYQVNYFVTNTYGIFGTASRNVFVIDSPTISNPSATLLATNAANALRTARFSASVNPNGSPTIVSIDYGLTAGYGATSSTNILPGITTAQTTTIDVPLSPGFTFHWRFAATNGVDSIPGSAFSPDQVITVPAAFLPGDINGDGIVDQSELNTVYSNYLPTSPWLSMTNVVGLGETNVTFALSNSISGGYSVEVSTNLTDWQFLGSATPRYLFTDTNSPAAPQRYYRLRYP